MKNDGIPIGWTDDMNIQLIGEIDFETLIDQVLSRFRAYEDFNKIYDELIVTNVSEYDRDIVLDRALGGIVRALTGNKLNRPDKTKDPIAYKTFVTVWNTFEDKGFLLKKKKVGGFWKKWNDWRLEKYSK